MGNAWYIYGAGGYGMETLDILIENINVDSNITPLFLVDEKSVESVNGTQVEGRNLESEGFVTISIGEPAIRAEIFKSIIGSKLTLKSLISRHAFVSEFAQIGEGCIIAPMCSIQSTAVIKDNVAVNTGAIVGHDVVIEESSVISSQVNIGGGVTIGRESYIGMGSLIREGVKIGSNVIIGMGSVVHKDIPDGLIAMGNPARPLKRNIDKKVFS
jgi:sugar O-acyltransferase (sialic acid O-acetyltransferase NeuD family)